jgi:hypothetical protein
MRRGTCSPADIEMYDAETAATLARGCASVEKTAAAMYGRCWRKKYRQDRAIARNLRWPASRKEEKRP